VRLDHITERIESTSKIALSPDCFGTRFNGLPDDDSESEPPDPIPNSVVKRLSADGSVGFPHVRVGHRQASHPIKPTSLVGFMLSRV
jgi:hypothetical protein